MENLNNKYNNNNELEGKTEKIRAICKRMGLMYTKIYKKETIGFNYYNYKNTSKFVCFLSRNLLMQVSVKNFSFYGSKYNNHPALKIKYVNMEESTIMIIYEKNIDKFKPQVGFIDKCVDMLTTPFVMLESAKTFIHKLTSTTSKLILIDLISLMLNLRDGYFTATKLVSCLMQIYTLHCRYMDLFHKPKPNFVPQTGANLTELLVGLSLMGLPVSVMNAIKNFSALTGKRIFESDLLLDMGEKLFANLILIVEWIANPVMNIRLLSIENEQWIIMILRKLGTSVFMHSDIKSVCEIYTKYVSNPQCLFDPTFRQEIMNKYDSLKSSAVFMDYIQNGNNKYFMTTWNLFEANVVKSCQAFDTSGREEPICFVFEGEAGSGKSCVMNQFVNLLRESGMTTICHSVPAAEDGKDFYDDYENQEVFVMDDVGQQGKSQWRYLINYVSPVKYPLPCATASKKNTKFFNSKIILCTTNHFMDLNGFTSSDCISEPEALYRRAHVIKITRGNTDHFSQVLEYNKYDHIGSKVWENKFINHAALNVPNGLSPNFSTVEDYSVDNTKRILKWLYTTFLHVLKSERLNNSQMSIATSDYRDIIREVTMPVQEEVFVDVRDNIPAVDAFNAQIFDFVGFLSNTFYGSVQQHLTTVIDYYAICEEYVRYYTLVIFEQMKIAAATIAECVFSLVPLIKQGASAFYDFISDGAVIRGILMYVLMGFAGHWFFGESEVSLPTPEFNASTVKEFDLTKKHDFFGPQSDILVDDHNTWVDTVRKGCKTLIVKDYKDKMMDEHTQCIVSGKRILLPAHLDIGDRFVDLYHSWQHYKERHVEIENVQLKLIKKYVISDLAVYEIIGTVPLYKLNRHVFSGSATSSKNWYLINSAGHIPVVYDLDVKRNDEAVTYATVAGKWNHDKGSGFYTPFTSSGACGTVLAAPGAGIIGFHVAGNSSLGFCVQPPNFVMNEVRELMLDAPCATNFELDTTIVPDFSGVRVRYEGAIEQKRPMSKTTLTPSLLHMKVCDEMRELITYVEYTPTDYTLTPLEEIDIKGPPIFDSRGTPAKTLKALSKKTFMHQGRVTPSEIEFMKQYIRAIMVNFDDLDDREVAFGGDYVPALNKDSSNGYHCLRGKDKYFDFENKEIKDTMKELAERVRVNALKGNYDYNDFMCNETFKDELRKSTKVGDPRTFRVMPLGHMWWTKKIFGKLLKHFKEHRMETGISVGYNPYKDADPLAKQLLLCEATGDADFGKWDGTIVAAIIRLITDVMKEFYTGEHDYVIDWLTNTIANSFVLVNDEIWATTHGLPSGTWLTLLLNCLLNKCLTSLVIYRYKPNPCVDDVKNVVDFVTGDDKVFGADKELSKYFNLLNIKNVSESLGMDCTNGDKTKITKASQPFDKLTYVKRHFRKHPILNRYVGCLSLDTIFNTLQWVRTDVDDTHEAMLGKMRSMQVESYLHSPYLFNELTNIFNINYPFDAFFSEDKVIKILQSDEGYDYITNLQGKNFSF
ncbi:hypothetical protein 1 [Shahe heteroptera virus 4]|uniref:hypothetical protein 1 n=1 Tax=Shahe heteroptera virus 4 TaxID=1923420 RepID=UPI00090AB57F|nr:hypothetical protein 1 [Shahe heteroptera virus 4]APG77358.1 hypothetical protein 1 [Shahe heteroptera virus 4]